MRNGIGEVPLKELAIEAFREQLRGAGHSSWLFPENSTDHQETLKTVSFRQACVKSTNPA
jgi:hypothetical protein